MRLGRGLPTIAATHPLMHRGSPFKEPESLGVYFFTCFQGCTPPPTFTEGTNPTANCIPLGGHQLSKHPLPS